MDTFRIDEKAMSLARIACRAQIGLDAPLVQVEVNLGSGLPMFWLVVVLCGNDNSHRQPD